MTEKIQKLIEGTKSISISDSIELYDSPLPGLPLLKVDSPLCSAVISLYGAQLLEFKTTDKDPILWLSPKAVFKQGTPIRGGIPICAPWFGPHPTDQNKPNHGFVRCNNWDLTKAEELDNGEILLNFNFKTSKMTTDSHGFQLQIDLAMTLGQSIKLKLSANNLGNDTIPFSWAFHSYFQTSELETTQVSGLSDRDYLDQTNKLASVTQKNNVTFESEVDRVYQQTGNTQTILRSASDINITGQHCPTTIVWNPGVVLAGKMSDIGPKGYLDFVCVERGAVFDDIWQIAPDTVQHAELEISSSVK